MITTYLPIEDTWNFPDKNFNIFRKAIDKIEEELLAHILDIDDMRELRAIKEFLKEAPEGPVYTFDISFYDD